MKVKRLFGLLISIVLVVALAGGCSSSKDAGTDTAQSKTEDVVTSDKSDAVNKAAATDNTANDAAASKDNAGEEGTVDSNEAAGNTEDAADAADASASTTGATKGGLTVSTDVEGGYTVANGIYTITKGGTYSFQGELINGQIYVDVPDDEKVEIELAGVTITNDSDSCIYIKNADEATISAKKNSTNLLRDTRAKKTSDEDASGSGCIYSKDDLKLSGKGELVIEATYNNGIACKNDIKIKNIVLEVSAPNNAIKGNDSITIESGELTVVSTEGDGLKTKNTDISSKGKQRGWILIEGGTVNIFAADDCIKAAFDFKISEEAVVTEKRYK